MTVTLFDVNSPLNAPDFPPGGWFDPPVSFDPHAGLVQINLDGPDEGRVVALVAPEGERILASIDFQPPQSLTGYEFAHVGTTITAEGETIRTANVGGLINHAPATASMAQAQDTYANTATKTLRGRYHDVPGVGVVLCGSAWPGLSKRDALEALGMAISGDWRYVPSLGARELAGSQLVNTPALRPLPRGVQRTPAYRPARFMAVAASLGDDSPVWGEWVDDTDTGRVGDGFAARIARLESAVSTLIAADTDDVRLDHRDVFDTVFGCKACAAHGCPACHGTGVTPYDVLADVGFDMADEFADLNRDGVPDSRDDSWMGDTGDGVDDVPLPPVLVLAGGAA